MVETVISEEAGVTELVRQSGVNPNHCYQCGKCSGGCPLSFAMDYSPSMVMRMLQVGMLAQVLSSKTIWLCASCETCSTRCPQDVDVAGLMDALRIMAWRKGSVDRDNRQAAFHRAFLHSLKSHGRLYELGLALTGNAASGKVTKDLDIGLPLLIKRKIKLLPPRIKGRRQIKLIFTRTLESGGKQGE